MKIPFFFILILLSSFVYSLEYYVSPNGNDTNDGLSEGSPFKTISKLTTNSLNPGDRIRFERGGRWNESFRITDSGNSSHYISIGSYGVGDYPIIAPSDDVDSWTQYSGDIYYATIPSSTVYGVFVNGQSYNLSKEPNNGYLDIEKSSNNNWFVDDELTYSEAQLLGAGVRIMTSNWRTESRTISSYNTTEKNITLSSSTDYRIDPTEKYYLDNKLWMLDEPGEYWINTTSNQLFIYVHGGGSPANHDVIITRINHALDFEKVKYIRVENLTLMYGEKNIRSYSSNYTQLKNLNLLDAVNGHGFVGWFTKNVSFDNIYINNSLVGGISISGVNTTIKNTIIENIGISGNYRYSFSGISIGSTSGLIGITRVINTTLRNIAYVGISVAGDDKTQFLVDNNRINRTCVRFDDCGFIMTNGRFSNSSKTISNNVLAHSIGGNDMRWDTEGLNKNRGFGIYLDDGVKNIIVINNTVSYAERGIFLHGASHNQILNNTVLHSRNNSFGVTTAGAHSEEAHNNTIKHNVFMSNSTDSTVSFMSFFGDRTNKIGFLNDNVYVAPYGKSVYRIYNTSYYRLNLTDYFSQYHNDSDSIEIFDSIDATKNYVFGFDTKIPIHLKLSGSGTVQVNKNLEVKSIKLNGNSLKLSNQGSVRLTG